MCRITREFLDKVLTNGWCEINDDIYTIHREYKVDDTKTYGIKTGLGTLYPGSLGCTTIWSTTYRPDGSWYMLFIYSGYQEETFLNFAKNHDEFKNLINSGV